MNKNPLEKSVSSGSWWVTQGLSCWASQYLVGDAMHIFSFWGPVIDDSFLLMILLWGLQLTILPVVDVQWYLVRAPLSGLLTPF